MPETIPTNSRPPSARLVQLQSKDFERLQVELQSPLLQRVLGELQQQLQARLVQVSVEPGLPSAERAQKVAELGGQSQLLSIILGGGLLVFAERTLSYLDETQQRQFQPYTRLDTDD